MARRATITKLMTGLMQGCEQQRNTMDPVVGWLKGYESIQVSICRERVNR